MRRISKLASLLLVTLFFSISVIQASHNHKFSTPPKQSFNSSDEKVSEANSCQICDYLAHIQSKQLFIVYAAVLVLAVSVPALFQRYSFVGNYKFTLQGFTNKGPPVSYC